MIQRPLAIVAALILLLGAAVAAGCGSGSEIPAGSGESGTLPSAGSEVTVGSTVAASTGTAETVQATTSTVPDTTSVDAAQADYREDVKKWWAKWTPKVEERLGVLDDLDPLTVTDDQIRAVGKCADVVNDAAKAFRSIKPPASAASAHADYASMLQGMANAFKRLQKALDAGESSGLMEAMSAFEVVMEESDAVMEALQRAVGVKLGGD